MKEQILTLDQYKETILNKLYKDEEFLKGLPINQLNKFHTKLLGAITISEVDKLIKSYKKKIN